MIERASDWRRWKGGRKRSGTNGVEVRLTWQSSCIQPERRWTRVAARVAIREPLKLWNGVTCSAAGCELSPVLKGKVMLRQEMCLNLHHKSNTITGRQCWRFYRQTAVGCFNVSSVSVSDWRTGDFKGVQLCKKLWNNYFLIFKCLNGFVF